MKRIERVAAVIAALLAGLPLAGAIHEPVQVTGGLVAGVPGTDPSILAFKAIPFAAPPVGNLRWRAPQPVSPWQGVKRSEKFSASCMQSISTEERQPWTYEFMTHNEISEDCLYLNVWTGAKSAAEKRPVYVYVYGGGFNSGSVAVPLYDGEGLAKKGLVVVTFNYRVNIMGFFVHPELTKESGYNASGNYGLLDQIAALKWVQANIARFGGDPNRVTVAGQSAGGWSVHDLISSPLAHGLFQRAIIESGGSTVGRAGVTTNTATLANAEAAGVRFAEAKGAKSIADLRAMSWQELSRPAGGRGAAATGAPVIDGYVLPAPETDVMAEGKQNDVPLLTGLNTGELASLTGRRVPVTLESFHQFAKQRFGDDADKVLALYPASDDREAATAEDQALRDMSLVSMYLWAGQRSKTSKTKLFQYIFDHTLPGPEAARLGAFHSAELVYVLNTLYAAPKRPFADTDRQIAATLSSYWANFATNGDPNGKGLAPWPAYSGKPVVMELGDKDEPVPVASSAARQAFFEAYFTRP